MNATKYLTWWRRDPERALDIIQNYHNCTSFADATPERRWQQNSWPRKFYFTFKSRCWFHPQWWSLWWRGKSFAPTLRRLLNS